MEVTEVVAIIGAIGIMGGATVTAVGNRIFLKKNLGTANGQGNVIEMGEALLTAFHDHAQLDELRFKHISDQIDANTQQIIGFAAGDAERNGHIEGT